MARLAPMENMAEFFGLHALIRQATAFIAPLLVGLLTVWSGSQRIGLAVAIPLIVAGAIMLLAVREERALQLRDRSADGQSGGPEFNPCCTSERDV